jgi:hypothetical protein
VSQIEVSRVDVERIMSRFHVRVTDGAGSSEHDVTLSSFDYERLGKGYRSPEGFIRACFEFLLAREPMDSILPSFDVSQIKDHFPEFEQGIDKPTD